MKNLKLIFLFLISISQISANLDKAVDNLDVTGVTTLLKSSKITDQKLDELIEKVNKIIKTKENKSYISSLCSWSLFTLVSSIAFCKICIDIALHEKKVKKYNSGPESLFGVTPTDDQLNFSTNGTEMPYENWYVGGAVASLVCSWFGNRQVSQTWQQRKDIEKAKNILKLLDGSKQKA